MIVTDGKSHEVDSSEMAFRTASIMAFRQGKYCKRRCFAQHWLDPILQCCLGMANANPIILEPIMSVAVEVPSEFQVRCSIPGLLACRGHGCIIVESANELDGAQGNVVGDLNKRKGVISTTETNMDITKVEAEVHRTAQSVLLLCIKLGLLPGSACDDCTLVRRFH
jgi:elongation factor G